MESNKVGRPEKAPHEKRERNIAARLTDEEHAAAQALKQKLRLKRDSDVITLFLQAVQGKSTSELQAFLYPPDKDESSVLRLLAA